MNRKEELEKLIVEYDKLQEKYGAKELKSIYNGGKVENPELCFVFMNPTGRNIASETEWKGIQSPWIGTKNIWKLFFKIGLLDKEIFENIELKKPADWDESFAQKVYENVEKHNYFITNLGKCTQLDARPLSNSVYMKYLELLFKEFEIIKPKKIITFGNQVSSIILNKKICVSECRKKKFSLRIKDEENTVYPVYYPIGNGMRNIDKAVEDIIEIMKSK